MIKSYIGLLGEGKTLSMIADAVEYLKQGKKVVTNTPFYYPTKGTKKDKENPNYKVGQDGKSGFFPEFEPDGRKFMSLLFASSNCLFVVDEAAIVWSAYDWNKMGSQYIMKFAQARKYGLDIFFTTQGYSHVVRRVRDLTNFVVKCYKTEVFGQMTISNIYYDPEFFAQRIISSPQVEAKYIKKRKILLPWDVKKVYTYYDTFYKVDFNAFQNQFIKNEAENKDPQKFEDIDFIEI